MRIAMTVAAHGQHDGQLITIVGESGLNSDNPVLAESAAVGRINPDLTLGTDVTAAEPLEANKGLSCNGIMLAGKGFRISSVEAMRLIQTDGEQARQVVRPHIGGIELVQRALGDFVIDFTGLTESAARKAYPRSYQHLGTSIYLLI